MKTETHWTSTPPGPIHISMDHTRHMKDAETCALSSTHHRQWVGAVLVLRSGRRYFGLNQTKTHPLQKRFEQERPRNGIHAEIHALSVALRHHAPRDLVDATIYVARANRLLARPCESCSRALEHYGVSTVYYTQDRAWTGPWPGVVLDSNREKH